jgi:uncharacterized membrane protein HdeD (DUF308 family)
VSSSGVAPTSSWSLPVARAVPALVFAAVVTFSADHSPRFGLLTFGIFAIVEAVAILAVVGRSVAKGARVLTVLRAGVSAASGIAALFTVSIATPSLLLAVVSGWAVVAGALDLISGVRNRRSSLGRDGIFVGVATLALALVLLLLPPGYENDYVGENGIGGTISASIIAVGATGAWAAIAGFFGLIGGLTARRAAAAPREQEA